MKIVKYSIVFLIVLTLNITCVKASTIHSIDVDLKLDEEGNGVVTEIWNMNFYQNTEVYKPMTNLANSQITDFKVIDEIGNVFEFMDSWNPNATLEEKAYKNGFNYIKDGIELCWGPGINGRHTYTISYKVSNMIYNLDDSQVLYWMFINEHMVPCPFKIKVTISGQYRYSDDIKFWSYGYDGNIFVENDNIVMTSTSNRDFWQSEYVVALIKYPLNTFKTDNVTDKFSTFEEVKTMADKDIDKIDNIPIYHPTNDVDDNGNRITIIFAILFIVIFIGVIARFLFVINRGPKLESSGQFVNIKTKIIKKKIKERKIPYFRDIPQNLNLAQVYFLSDIYKLNYKRSDIIGAILLKWLKEDKIKVIYKENSNKKNKEMFIELNSLYPSNDYCETWLSKQFKFHSINGLISKDIIKDLNSDFGIYSLPEYFETILEYEKSKYIDSKNITVISSKKEVKYILDEYLYNEAIKLAGLKKYLRHFSRINKKEPMDVKLWEEYLIYAQIFGIAKRVSKQFKKLSPEFSQQYDYDFQSITFVSSISSVIGHIKINDHVNKDRDNSSSNRDSSSGNSYSRGGSGSFGGGHGGGTR